MRICTAYKNVKVTLSIILPFFFLLAKSQVAIFFQLLVA